MYRALLTWEALEIAPRALQLFNGRSNRCMRDFTNASLMAGLRPGGLAVSLRSHNTAAASSSTLCGRSRPPLSSIHEVGMPRFSANLGFLWPEQPLLERIASAARAGFKAIEVH